MNHLPVMSRPFCDRGKQCILFNETKDCVMYTPHTLCPIDTSGILWNHTFKRGFIDYNGTRVMTDQKVNLTSGYQSWPYFNQPYVYHRHNSSLFRSSQWCSDFRTNPGMDTQWDVSKYFEGSYECFKYFDSL